MTSRERYQRQKHEALCAYGGERPHCACCGEDAIEFLVLDHINEDGSKHRQMMTGTRAAGAATYRWLKKHGYPNVGLRVMCGNCNQSTTNGRTCPHQRPLLHVFAGVSQ